MSDWESYWQQIETTGSQGQVLWDAEDVRAFQLDLEHLLPYFDPDLPLLDVGCGNGRQARFFSRHFKQVIGVDVSESAVALARQEAGPASSVIFRVLDGLDPQAAQAFHAEFGDVNVYLRAVLHITKWHARRQFIENLAVLLGRKGTLYQVDMTSESFFKLRSLPDDVASRIPKITPRVGFNPEDVPTFYPADRWNILEQGDQVEFQTTPLPDGSVVVMPGIYLVLRPVR